MAKTEKINSRTPARLGIFCGTFNPVHWGHLLMAEFARRQLALTKIIFVTSPNPPHRHDDLLGAEDRFTLVSAAVADNPAYEASRCELERQGPSYTVDTLRKMRAEHPEAQLYLIIGQDNLPYIAKWKDAAEIFKLCKVVVAPRTKQIVKHTDPQEPSQLPASACVIPLELPYVNVSSSEIRRRLREDMSVLYMVPSSVNRLLLERRCYR